MSWPSWTGMMTGDAYNVMRNQFNLGQCGREFHLHIVWKFGGGCSMAALGFCWASVVANCKGLANLTKHSDRHVHHANVATVVPIQRDATAWKFSSKLETKENQLLPSVGAFGNRNIQKKTSQKIGEPHSKRSNTLPSTTWICFHLSRFNPCCPTCCPPTVHPAPTHKGKAVGSRKPRNATSQLTCRSAALCGLSHCHSQPHKPETKHQMLSPTLHCHLFGESAQTGLVRHHPFGWRHNPSSWTCSRSYERSLKLRCNQPSGLHCVTVTRHKKSTVNGKPKNPRRNLFGRAPSSKFGEWRLCGRETCAIRNNPFLNTARQTKNKTNERRN